MGAASCLDSGERSRERTARSQSGALWRCIPQHPAWEPTQRSRSRTPMTAPFDRSPRTAHVLRAHAMSREPTTRSAQRCSLFAGCFPRARALWLLNLWQSSRPTSSFCFFFLISRFFLFFFSPLPSITRRFLGAIAQSATDRPTRETRENGTVARGKRKKEKQKKRKEKKVPNPLLLQSRKTGPRASGVGMLRTRLTNNFTMNRVYLGINPTSCRIRAQSGENHMDGQNLDETLWENGGGWVQDDVSRRRRRDRPLSLGALGDLQPLVDRDPPRRRPHCVECCVLRGLCGMHASERVQTSVCQPVRRSRRFLTSSHSSNRTAPACCSFIDVFPSVFRMVSWEWDLVSIRVSSGRQPMAPRPRVRKLAPWTFFFSRTLSPLHRQDLA